MSYVGNPVQSIAYLTDQFSGTGSQTAFTMSVAPANPASIMVAIHGVVQDPSTYSVVGTTLNFSQAPPGGTGNISVRYMGVPAAGVVTTAYRTVTEFTATASQTVFTPPAYTVGFIEVYRNGIRLHASDFTATNGTSVTLGVACTAGDSVALVSFYVSNVLNAIPATANAINSLYLSPNLTLVSPNATTLNSPSTLSLQTGGNTAITVDANQNVGVGTSAPGQKLTLMSSTSQVGIQFGQNGNFTNAGYIYNDGTSMIIASAQGSTGKKVFINMSAPDNAVTLDSNGNMGLGGNGDMVGLAVQTPSYTTAYASNLGGNAATAGYGSQLQVVSQSDSSTVSGISLFTRTTGRSRWDILNVWTSTYVGDLVFRGRSGGTANIEALRINSNGVLVLQGGTTAAAGTGIAFPATQNPSSDANTLDDYEEGTWTPTWAGSGSNPTATYGSQLGRYIKIGRMVWIYCAINVLTFSGGSGNLQIAGLPFAVDPNTADGGFAIGQMAFWSVFPTSVGTITNSTILQLYKSGNNTPSVMSDINASANADYIRFQGCYLTAN